MSSLLHKCITKATAAEGDQMKYGPNWAFSRRAPLKVFDDHLECGNWNINTNEIENAVLYSIKSIFLFPGYVLKIETKEKCYHFGLNWGKFWKGELPFQIRREKGKMGYTKFSFLLRLVLLAMIVYYLWEKFSK